MGLDSSFSKSVKQNDSFEVNEQLIKSLFSIENSELVEDLKQLNEIACAEDDSLFRIIHSAFKEYIHKHEVSVFHEGILYFRNFHFLNDYFDYDDSWYSKDKVVTKEQCIYLRDLAKKCLNSCSRRLSDKEREEGCRKYFPCEDVNLYNKVRDLYYGMCSIINDTNWDREQIIYNADW